MPNNNVGSIVVKTATVTLTNAQIKASPTALIEIVPTPGADKAIWFFRGALVLNAVAGIYTDVDSGALAHFILGTGNQSSNFLLSDFLFETEIVLASFTAQSFQNQSNTSLDEFYVLKGDGANKPLNFEVINSVPFGGGNVANSMKITAWYTILDT